MALDIPERFDGPITVSAVKGIRATFVQTKLFKVGTGTLVVGRPVGIETATDLWAPWNNANSPAGTNVVKGIVFPRPIVLDAADEVHGEVMLRGEMSINDVELGGESLANLKTAIKTAPRALGLDFLDYVYSS